MGDDIYLHRAMGILFRLGLENTGWRGWFRRWCYSDEPLRNDASRLVREYGYAEKQPVNTRQVAEDHRNV